MMKKFNTRDSKDKHISKFGSSECTDTLNSLQRTASQMNTKKPEILRKSIYEHGMTPNNFDQSKPELQDNQAIPNSSNQVPGILEFQSSGDDSLIVNKTSKFDSHNIVRKSIFEKHNTSKLQNYPSCTSFGKNPLVNENEIETDIFNLKTLRKKLSEIRIAEENEKKKKKNNKRGKSKK